MHEEIKVSIFKRAGRKFWYMQYRDPMTGDKVVKSTGETVKRQASQRAGSWKTEIINGLAKGGGMMPWQEFRQRYRDDVLAGLAEKTEAKATGVLNVLERTLRLRRIADVTTDSLTRYQRELRSAGRSENTIKSHLAHIGAALSWAVDVGFLNNSPKIPKVQRARKTQAKGRAVTSVEMELLIDTAESIVNAQNAPSWIHLLWGLYWSGLRLGEAMRLSWDDATTICLDFTTERPMLLIPAELEKGHRDRLMPIASEFAKFLDKTPAEQRTGFVFNPKPRRFRYGDRPSAHHAGRLICAMGKLAGIVVSESPAGKVKYASAHDLRRAFGLRWAQRVMPAVLRDLMRHESIDTTMRFYVGHNAKATAELVWRAMGDTLGDTLEAEGEKTLVFK